MKKLSLLLLLISSCNPAIAQQVQVTRDELPNTGTAESTVVLNNVLRQNQNAINAIGGYFNSSGYLNESSGGTGTNLSNVPNGSVLIQDSGNVGIGTFGQGSSGQYLQSLGAGNKPTWSVPTDLNRSNVLFQYSAALDLTGSGLGELSSTSLVSTGTGNYRYLSVRSTNSNYVTVWSTKWIKTAGVSTITFYAQTWMDTNNGENASVRLTVGGQSGTATGTIDQVTPEWVMSTVDVSGLVNGTTYDVTANIAHLNNLGGALSVYLGNLISFGS